MGSLTQTQISALVAALASLMALAAAFIHDRMMTGRSTTGAPWVKPRHPLALLAMATLFAVMTAILALQGR